MKKSLVACLFLLLSGVAYGTQEDAVSFVTSSSVEKIAVTSRFSGEDLVIFGAIEDKSEQREEYDIIVVMKGPLKNILVRKKERIAGIWVNAAEKEFHGVPSSYLLYTNRPLADITSRDIVDILNIGDTQQLDSDDISSTVARNESFLEAFYRLMKNKGLYLEDSQGIEFLSPILFKTQVKIPANIPIGPHEIEIFLFHKGEYVKSTHESLRIEKIGLEQYTYDMAYNRPVLYGLMVLSIAIFTGWFASVIFRR